MAEHLASIFGTEKDRVNCPFYFKIGACRHGDRCSRLHNKPTISQTLLLTNMYQNPALNAPPGPDGLPQAVDPRTAQDHFEDFYEDVFEELCVFGEIENLNVCDNLADHMVGNVYVKFRDEESAAKALQALQGRFYAGRPILAEFSPVTDFREATCRQYEENTCSRGGYCNFMHLKPISRELRKVLFGRYKRRRNDGSRSPRRDKGNNNNRGYDGRDGRHHSSRSYSPKRGRSRERDQGRGRPRDDSAERRARIAAWNREREPNPSPPAAHSPHEMHGGDLPPQPAEFGNQHGYDGKKEGEYEYAEPPYPPPAEQQ